MFILFCTGWDLRVCYKTQIWTLPPDIVEYKLCSWAEETRQYVSSLSDVFTLFLLTMTSAISRKSEGDPNDHPVLVRLPTIPRSKQNTALENVSKQILRPVRFILLHTIWKLTSHMTSQIIIWLWHRVICPNLWSGLVRRRSGSYRWCAPMASRYRWKSEVGCCGGQNAPKLWVLLSIICRYNALVYEYRNDKLKEESILSLGTRANWNFQFSQPLWNTSLCFICMC